MNLDIEREISYIYSYIEYVFFPVEELKNNKFRLDIARRIKDNMTNSTFINGDYDFYINNFVSQELRQRKSASFEKLESIRNYVYLLINYCKIYDGINIENYNVAINEIVRYIYGNLKYEDIMEGKCDREIESLIKRNITSSFVPKNTIDDITLDISHIRVVDEELVDDRVYIQKYVKNYLNGNKYTFNYKGDMNYLSNLICTDLYLNKVKYEDIIDGKYNELIDSYIKKICTE